MENKYYTPSLEELHIGFKCEYSTLANTEGANHHNWDIEDDVIVGELDSFLLKSTIIEVVEEAREMPIRVKYLDKSDIISLGFSSKPEDYEYGLVSKGEFVRVYEDEIIIIRTHWHFDLTQRENLIRVFKGIKYKFPYTEIFRGNIKNRSELEKLLKQLQIKQ